MARELVIVPIMPSPETLSVYGEEAEASVMGFVPLMERVEKKVREFDLKRDFPHKWRIQAYCAGYTQPTWLEIPDGHPAKWLEQKNHLIIVDQTEEPQTLHAISKAIHDIKVAQTFDDKNFEDDIPDEEWFPKVIQINSLFSQVDQLTRLRRRQIAKRIDSSLYIPENLGMLFMDPTSRVEPFLPGDIEVKSIDPDLDMAFQEALRPILNGEASFRAMIDQYHAEALGY